MMPLLLTWQEHMVCQVILGTILIQNRNFRDLSGLVDSLGTKMTFRAKFRDVNGNYAIFILIFMSCAFTRRALRWQQRIVFAWDVPQHDS